MAVKLARVFLFLLTGVFMVYVDVITTYVAVYTSVSSTWAWIITFLLTVVGLLIYLGVDGGIVKVFAKDQKEKKTA